MAHKASITVGDETYTGQRLDTIARREWGSTVEVTVSADTNNVWTEKDGTGSWFAGRVMITKTGRHGTHVLAEGIGRVRL
jgi:hypothetical protein